MDGLEAWNLANDMHVRKLTNATTTERDELVGGAIDAFIIHGEHVGTDITVHMISGVHKQTKSPPACRPA